LSYLTNNSLYLPDFAFDARRAVAKLFSDFFVWMSPNAQDNVLRLETFTPHTDWLLRVAFHYVPSIVDNPWISDRLYDLLRN